MNATLTVGPPADGVLVETVGQDIVLYGPATNQFFTLNHTAAAVWRLSDGSHSVADIAAALADEYAMTSSDILSDVAVIVHQLQDAGLLRVGRF